MADHDDHHKDFHASNTGQLVLIAIDASENAEYAFRFYMDTLHNSDNNLIFFHSTEPPYIGTGLGVAGYSFATGAQYEQMLSQRREDVKKLRNHYLHLLKGRQVNYRLHAIEFGGNPGEAIVKTAQEGKVDLIVMGTRGQGKLRRTILGSVSDYVINHAHCPVLVCHDPSKPSDHHHHHHHHQWKCEDNNGYHYKRLV